MDKNLLELKTLAMERECQAWVYDRPEDGVLWYLQEHWDEMDEWAECLKKTFCEMVDTIKKELQEDE